MDGILTYIWFMFMATVGKYTVHRSFGIQHQQIMLFFCKKPTGPSGERETFTLEFWKLAEEISQELPEWRWSASKPEQRKVAQERWSKVLGVLWLR